MASNPEKEFQFSKDDFDYLREIVRSTTGIISDEEKYSMYYSRLARRLRKLGLKNFTEYRHFLNSHRESESIELVNSMTTNLTSFFRENHHFEFLTNTIVPEKKRSGTRKIRIWSAGCSTGEEAYSIAITLAQTLPDYKNWDIKIVATDIDSNVLEQGAKGIYAENRVRDLDDIIRKRYFKNVKDDSGSVQVVPELSNMISFKHLNLLQSWLFLEKFDGIFCRNVVIYFDRETKNSLVARFADQLLEGGYLFMGHSESLFKTTDRFKLLGHTIYQKV